MQVHEELQQLLIAPGRLVPLCLVSAHVILLAQVVGVLQQRSCQNALPEALLHPLKPGAEDMLWEGTFSGFQLLVYLHGVHVIPTVILQMSKNEDRFLL